MKAAGLAWRLAFAMLLAVSVATLVGARWETLDLLSHFQGYLALAWLLALVVFACARRVRKSFIHPARAAACAGFLLLLHLTLLAQLFRPASPVSAWPAPPISLSVVWFNMEHKNAALRALESQLAENYPDLLALAETNRDTAPNPSWGLQHVLHDETARIGIWSRWPLEDRRAHAVAGDRDLLDATVVVNGHRLPVVAVHWRLPTRPSQKIAGGVLSNLVRSRPDCLVLGDFNATPWSASLRLLETEGRLWRVRLPFGPFNTWAADPWHLLGVPIDHFLIKGAVRAENLRLLPWNTSDHRPLQARLLFSAPG